VVERALADPNLLNEKCDPSPDWLQLLLEEVELEKANQLAKDRILKQSLSIDGWRQVTPLRKVLLHQKTNKTKRIYAHHIQMIQQLHVCLVDDNMLCH
jgi:hypothetical protein